MVQKMSIEIVAKNPEGRRAICEAVKDDIYLPAIRKCQFEADRTLRLIVNMNAPSFPRFKEVCEQYRFYPRITEVTFFTKREIENAEFYETFFSDPLELEGTSAIDYGTRYEGGCPLCGLGGKAIADVLVDKKFMRKKEIGSLRPDYFVSERIKSVIEKNRLTGVSFPHMVKDYKGREMVPYYTMEVESILPPMSEETWLKRYTLGHTYEACGHREIYKLSRCKYERQKLADAKDFNLSNEYLDVFRERELIVSRRVKQVFQENNIQGAYSPIIILEKKTGLIKNCHSEIIDMSF